MFEKEKILPDVTESQFRQRLDLCHGDIVAFCTVGTSFPLGVTGYVWKKISAKTRTCLGRQPFMFPRRHFINGVALFFQLLKYFLKCHVFI